MQGSVKYKIVHSWCTVNSLGNGKQKQYITLEINPCGLGSRFEIWRLNGGWKS